MNIIGKDTVTHYTIQFTANEIYLIADALSKNHQENLASAMLSKLEEWKNK